MGRIGEFDTSTEALTARIQAHANSDRNLEDWVFENFRVVGGQRVLELGCGTGKQTLILAKMVRNFGRVTAVDVNEESLHILRGRARAEDLDKNVVTVRAALDDFHQVLRYPENYFDAALACYSLYYAENMRKVLSGIHQSLRTGGQFFYCGPAPENNDELKDFILRFCGKRVGVSPAAEITRDSVADCEEIFSTVELFPFENTVRFDSAEGLHAYWSAHNMYDSSIDSDFQAAARSYFEKHKEFSTVKRVVGVLAEK